MDDRNQTSGYPALIFGRRDLPLFPFQQGYSLLGDLSYTFYSDRARWATPSTTADNNANR